LPGFVTGLDGKRQKRADDMSPACACDKIAHDDPLTVCWNPVEREGDLCDYCVNDHKKVIKILLDNE